MAMHQMRQFFKRGKNKVPLQMTSSLSRATKKETSQSIFKEAVHFILRHARNNRCSNYVA